MLDFCHICLSPPSKLHSQKPLPLNLIQHLYTLIGKEVSNVNLWLCRHCNHLLRKYVTFRNLCLQSATFIENFLIKNKCDKSELENVSNLKRKEIGLALNFTPINSIDISPNIEVSDCIQNDLIDNVNGAKNPCCKIEETKDFIDSKISDNANEANEERFTNDLNEENSYISDDEPIIRLVNVKKNNDGKKTTIKLIKSKKSIYDTPSKNFDSSMVTITHLSKEQQLAELEKMKTTNEYLRSPYKCEMCAKGFSHEIVFKDHQEKHDPVSGQYVCNLCNQRFNTKRNLRNHIDTHAFRYTCRLCKKVLISKQNIMSHMYTEHDESNKEVKCDLCQRLYKNRYSYKKHMRIHRNSKEYKCHLCHKVFLWKDNLNRHLTRHKSEKPFKCNSCPKAFFLKENLKDHQLTHSNEKQFYCVECDLSYVSQVKLNQHLKRGARHLKPEQLTFACKLCDKKYTNNQQLSMHMDRIHLNKRSQTCQFCDASFVSKKTLQIHVKVIHEGYKKPRNHICETCGKGFIDKHVLKAHIRTHTGEKPYTCKYCGVKFAHSGAMYTHIKLVHMKMKRTSISSKCRKGTADDKLTENTDQPRLTEVESNVIVS